jgi:predicted transcriptional regulator
MTSPAQFPQLLRDIGLTETEIKVYQSLLFLGPTYSQYIIEYTNLHRKNTYDALNRLIEKGLVTYVIENKKKRFQPKNPSNLLRFLQEKKNQLTAKQHQLVQQLPLLQQQFHTHLPEIESEIYRGTDGIKTILKDCLHHKEILFIGATGDVETRLPYFWPQYNKEREQRKILWKLLLVHEAQHKPITKSKYYQYKVLPKILSGPNVIYIYGNTIANVLWLEKPIAFVITHKDLADNYRKYFNYLWENIP